MTIIDYNLNFAKTATNNEWDLGSAVGGTTNYAPDAITLPTDTQSWDDIGAGEELYAHIAVTETFVAGGTPSITFELGIATDNAGSGFVTIASYAGTEATLQAITQSFVSPEDDIGLGIPPGTAGVVTLKLDPLSVDLDGTPQGKFLSLRCVIGGVATTNDLSAGKVKAWLGIGKGNGVQNLKHFHQSGFTV